jgi:RNA polymerase sigma-70 factor (ECF subfamily)
MTAAGSDEEQRWARLMARSQRGERAPYEQLLAELGRAIESYIRLRFGRLDILEDCVQECLITVHQARHTYDPVRPFRPWLFTLVRHRTIDLLRQRETWMNARRALAQVEVPASVPDTLLDYVDGLRLLQCLAPDHREVVVLAKYGGYTTAEAAQWLGISESATKARLHRALNALRKILEREDA